MALISGRDLHLAFGGPAVLSGAHFSLDAGERVCLIGRNGEGKSTLLKIINQHIVPDGGEINRTNGLSVAMMEQDVPIDHGLVKDIVAQGAGEAANLLTQFHEASMACADGDDAACDRMATLQHDIDVTNGWQLEREVDTLLARMDLDGNEDLSALSGGRKRRVLLARALISRPDILLLDEPTNHLDVQSIEWLEELLLGWPQLTLLFISHDRAFVDRLATRIIELDRGQLRSYQGNYARYLELKELEIQAEEKQNALFDKKLAQEEVWIRQGIKARRTRNEGRVRELKALREERKARREQQGQVSFSLQDSQRSGKVVFEVDNLGVAYDAKPLVKNFSAVVMRGDKIALIGNNGVGKTTLIRALLNEIPFEGQVKQGTQLEVAYFDQLRNQLDLESTVIANVAAGSDFVELNGQRKHILSYLQDFLFSPERARTPVKALSGGERNRLLLARLLLKPANLLVLDEPTNDLDMVTLELLEDILLQYQGTLLLISHDRAFVDAVATSTWVFDGAGHIEEFVGGYQDYLHQRKQTLIKNQAERKSTAINSNANQTTNTANALLTGTTNSANTAAKKEKLSYKEQRELQELPAKVAALEDEQTRLSAQLADGTWYTTDITAATAAAQRLGKIEEQLLESLERWTALEEKA